MGIADVAKVANVTVEQAKAVLDAIKASPEPVRIQGYGTFKTVTKPARLVENPQNRGEKIQVPARVVLQFKAAKPKKAA